MPYWTPLYNKTFLRTTKITFKKLSDNANNNDEGEYYAQKQDSFWVITGKKMKTIFLKLIAFNNWRIANCDQTVEQI